MLADTTTAEAPRSVSDHAGQPAVEARTLRLTVAAYVAVLAIKLIAYFVTGVLALAGQQWADPLAAVVIATIITVKAISLFRENLCLLIGRAPDAKTLDAMRAAVLAVPGVAGVREMRAEYVSPGEVHLGMHIEVDRGTPSELADEIASTAAVAVHRIVTGAYCVIHVGPAGSRRDLHVVPH